MCVVEDGVDALEEKQVCRPERSEERVGKKSVDAPGESPHVPQEVDSEESAGAPEDGQHVPQECTEEHVVEERFLMLWKSVSMCLKNALMSISSQRSWNGFLVAWRRQGGLTKMRTVVKRMGVVQVRAAASLHKKAEGKFERFLVDSGLLERESGADRGERATPGSLAFKVQGAGCGVQSVRGVNNRLLQNKHTTQRIKDICQTINQVLTPASAARLAGVCCSRRDKSWVRHRCRISEAAADYIQQRQS